MSYSGSKNKHLLEKTQQDSVTSYNTVSNHSTNISWHVKSDSFFCSNFLIPHTLRILSYWSSNRQTKVTRTLWNKAVYLLARTIIGCANVRTRLGQAISPDRRLQSKKLIALRHTILLESPSLCGATLSIGITSLWQDCFNFAGIQQADTLELDTVF